MILRVQRLSIANLRAWHGLGSWRHIALALVLFKKQAVSIVDLFWYIACPRWNEIMLE